MTDVISQPTLRVAPIRRGPAPAYDLIELLFFAYRDFVGDADAALARFGFGRAHHRVLHFVSRNPGLTVADLLAILKITKQSLGRVLRDLVDEDYVESREGMADRRQRLLFATPKGDELARELAELQSARISRALERAGPDGHRQAAAFLSALVNSEDRDGVMRLIAGASGGRNP